MWTRKAAFTFTGGIALILIGMMISNHQMMILGIAFIAFIVVNSWKIQNYLVEYNLMVKGYGKKLQLKFKS